MRILAEGNLVRHILEFRNIVMSMWVSANEMTTCGKFPSKISLLYVKPDRQVWYWVQNTLKNQCWSSVQVNAWDQWSPPIMVSKNLPVGIKIVIPIKYWYVVGMSMWENLGIPELLFGSKPFLDHIDMSPVLPKCDDSWTVYRHEWYAKQKYCQISMSCWDKNLWNPRHRYQMVSKKISYQSNTGLYPSQIINSMGGHLLQQQPLNRPWISLSHGQQLSFTNPKTAISESVWSWLKYKRHETVWNLLWKDANVHRKKKKCNTVIDFNSENMKTC